VPIPERAERCGNVKGPKGEKGFLWNNSTARLVSSQDRNSRYTASKLTEDSQSDEKTSASSVASALPHFEPISDYSPLTCAAISDWLPFSWVEVLQQQPRRAFRFEGCPLAEADTREWACTYIFSQNDRKRHFTRLWQSTYTLSDSATIAPS
jgi:hypothetical protein